MNDTNTQISILCFSKNRPLQLEAYLTSLFQMCKEPCSVSVLYTCGLAYNASYEKLKNEFPNVSFISETHFTRQVSDIVRNTKTPFFMFGCDDVIFKGPWEPSNITRKFQTTPRLLAFSLRLGREITYCHPLDRNMSLPHFQEEEPLLTWFWPDGQADWGYPWELDSTAYSTNFVKAFMRKFARNPFARHKFDWSNPNKLEALGAGLIQRETTFDLMASYADARACVLTINIVQETFPNRVYQSEFAAKELLGMWNEGKRLDTTYYFGRTYKSIHIGDTRFIDRSTDQVSGTKRDSAAGLAWSTRVDATE